MHDRGVKQETADIAPHGIRLPASHAEQHLEFHPCVHPALLRKKPGPGNVEEIVSGHPDPHGVGAGRLQ